ncbi:MAG: tripartite tricarboxylate transporter substrate-binding protein, partial [Burkholderiales bacterium]
FAAPLGNALAPLRDARLRALAVTKGQRTSLLPDVPTVAESGLAYRWETWFGLLVSSKTPRALVQKLHADITRILEQPSVAAKWAALGAEVPRATPEEFDKIVRDDVATFVKSGRVAKIQPE